jgi:predicted PurR-regulated permease PerM
MTLSRSAALQWLTVAAILFGALYLLGPILAPFVAAAILAYICNPLVGRLRAWKLPRTLAVVLVMLGLTLVFASLLLIMLPLLQKEISLLVVRAPEWLETARVRLLPLSQQWFGITLEWDVQAFKSLFLTHWQSAGGVAAKLLPWLESSGGMLLGLLVNLLLIPVVMFYLLRDWNDIIQRIDHMIPRHWHA